MKFYNRRYSYRDYSTCPHFLPTCTRPVYDKRLLSNLSNYQHLELGVRFPSAPASRISFRSDIHMGHRQLNRHRGKCIVARSLSLRARVRLSTHRCVHSKRRGEKEASNASAAAAAAPSGERTRGELPGPGVLINRRGSVRYRVSRNSICLTHVRGNARRMHARTYVSRARVSTFIRTRDLRANRAVR